VLDIIALHVEAFFYSISWQNLMVIKGRAFVAEKSVRSIGHLVEITGA
jgi:hypothetical protein